LHVSSAIDVCLLDPPRFGFNGSWGELASAVLCVGLGIAGLVRLTNMSRRSALKRPSRPSRFNAAYYRLMTVMGATEDAIYAVRLRFGGAYLGLFLIGLLLVKDTLFSRC